jgi:hypothetical protein
MQGTSHTHRLPTLCRRDLWYARGDDPVLWDYKAVSTQRRECSGPEAISVFDEKLVQSALRQMVYLAIKELATTSEDVIMVTSSIMKDMQPNSEVIYRPNSIRALCRIIDVCAQVFRYGT